MYHDQRVNEFDLKMKLRRAASSPIRSSAIFSYHPVTIFPAPTTSPKAAKFHPASSGWGFTNYTCSSSSLYRRTS